MTFPLKKNNPITGFECIGKRNVLLKIDAPGRDEKGKIPARA
jgi:hypothetical protein